MARLPRPVITSTSRNPARTASSTTYWIEGLSTTGSISLGWLFVAGRNRVPIPAAGITAFVTGVALLLTLRRYRRPRRRVRAPRRGRDAGHWRRGARARTRPGRR